MTTLHDPSAAELLAAFVAAAESSDFSEDPDWRTLLDAIAGEAAGRVRVDNPQPRDSRRSYISLVWWSDYQGRRHVRVRGGAPSEFGRDFHHTHPETDPRPPVWHVGPERVFQVDRGDAEPVWLASCACGATGRPERVGWMIHRCGPCHDRHEDGLPPVAGLVPWLRVNRPVHALAFRPGGGSLAVAAGSRLSLFDLSTGAEESLAHTTQGESYEPLAFSPDGRFLAAGETMPLRLALWDIPSGGGESTFLFDQVAELADIRFSPHGRLLAATTCEAEFRMLRRDPPGWDARTWRRETAYAFAFSPDSREVAIADESGRIELRDAGSLAPYGGISLGDGISERVQFLGYGINGRDLIAVSCGHDPGIRLPWLLRRWNAFSGRETGRDNLPPCRAVTTTPDRRYLVTLPMGYRSPAVHFWDLISWRDAGWLAWDTTDAPACLAFSPDGETLATGSVKGVVKLWPWRTLLEGQGR